VEGTALENMFDVLDSKLYELGASDSAIEYAQHMREPFEDVIAAINEIKMYLGGNSKSIENYFL
jgi:hypothetical protein